MKRTRPVLFVALGLVVVAGLAYRVYFDRSAADAEKELAAKVRAEGSWEAAEKLGAMGVRVAPTMASLLEEQKWDVRMAATKGIPKMAPDQAVADKLAAIVADQTDAKSLAKALRTSAAEALGAMGAFAIPHANALFAKGDEASRAMSLYVVTHIAYYRPLDAFAAEDLIRKGLADEAYDVRDNAKAAIDWLNDHFKNKRPGDENLLDAKQKEFLAWVRKNAGWSNTLKTPEQIEAEKKMAEEGAPSGGAGGADSPMGPG
ncbi:MAG: hypothetical protein KIS66_04315 [Fimbriimonadaceae bacterium]|nr:hypothetical protein [Fimbriimonadaceae bacterium]